MSQPMSRIVFPNVPDSRAGAEPGVSGAGRDLMIAFEDLLMLDGVDLRAVFDEVTPDRAAEALLGGPEWLTAKLLNTLPSRSAASLRDLIAARRLSMTEGEGTGTAPGNTLAARADVLRALSRLARQSRIAFDNPEDLY